ncbi:PucR family transcriptional regulator [Paenibacillus sp. FSL K6-1230]|uniref:PucR family transcriptional regulator n=1 Tax=Paenibacillus sp. FSL K6-1230 TaxID=2921603 RepID=UPI0030F9F01D
MNGKDTFTIADLLKRPVFQRAVLVAGIQGVQRTVGWVHVLEITHVSPFVSRHDLILSTGLWMKRDEKERIEYMEQLIRQGAAGLCVEFGTTIDTIPEEILSLADAHQLPIIVFEQPVRFVEITQDIHSLLINRHHLLLQDLESFSRKLQTETLRSSDMTAILRLLQEYVSRQVVYMSTIDGNRFVPSIHARLAERLEQLYSQEVEGALGSDREAHSVFRLNEHTSILFSPVVCFGQVFSAVGIFIQADETLKESMSLLLDHTSRAAATLVLRTQFLEERTLRNQNELIQDLLHRRIANEEQAQSRMGLRLLTKGQYWFTAGMIEVEHLRKDISQVRREAVHQDLLVLLRSLLKKLNLHGQIMAKGNQVYLLCTREALTPKSIVHIREVLAQLIQGMRNYAEKQLEGVRIHAGFGRSRSRALEANQGFEEAYQVIEIARSVKGKRNVLFYEQLGIYQLLKAIPRNPFLTMFVEDHIGELIAYDLEHHMQLMDTLEMYLNCSGSKQDTADRLFIHRQTLYNRLSKIQEILGEGYMEADKRRCLEMALLAHRMLQGES